MGNSFSDISTTLVNDFIASHSLSQPSKISRADDPILTAQLISVKTRSLNARFYVSNKIYTQLFKYDF